MEPFVNTYSPSDVTLDIGGYILTGWDKIEVQRSAPGFRVIRGIRGKHTRVRVLDTSATIRASILQTSYANDVLSKVHQNDLDYGDSRLSIELRDSSGSSVFKSSEAYISKFPKVGYSNEFEFRPWEIFCQSVEVYNVGGNTTVQGSLFEAAVNTITDLF